MSRVPQELMDRLHQATEQFTQAKRRLDGVVINDAPRDGSAGAALRAAEKELEEATAEIDKCLAAKPGDGQK